MAQANKTRWTEKWAQIDGQVQEARMRVTEDSNYNEYTVVTLYPIKGTGRKATPKPTIYTIKPTPVHELIAKLDADRARAKAMRGN